MLEKVFILYSRHSSDSLQLVDRVRGDPNLSFVSTVRVDSPMTRKILKNNNITTVPAVYVKYVGDFKVFEGEMALRWIDETSVMIATEKANGSNTIETVKPVHPPRSAPQKEESMSISENTDYNIDVNNSSMSSNTIELTDQYSSENNSAIKPGKKETASIMQLAKQMEHGRDSGSTSKRHTGGELQDKINGSGFNESEPVELIGSSSLTGDKNVGGETTNVIELI